MKKSFTRILSVIMVLSMIFVLLPSMVSAANTNYGIIYLKVGEKYDLGSYIPNGVKIISWQESSPYIRLKDSVVYADSIGQATVTALASNYDTHTFTISVITNWNGYCPICGIYNCVQHMNPGFGNYYDHWCTICGNYWCNDINHYYSWTNDINWIYGWNHYCSICQNYYCTNANHMSYWTINNNWNNGWWHWCTKCESYNCANPDHMNNWIYIEGESNPHYCSICENYNCTNLKHSRYWSYYDGSYISSNYLSDLFFNGKHVYKFTRVYNGMRYLTIDEILKINPATDKYTFSIDGNNVYYGTLNDYVKNHEICKRYYC